jgi:hypothetical protein
VRLEVGVHDQRKFNELAAPVEAKHVAPWLKRGLQDGVEVIRVVDLEKGVERLATPAEIESGVYFKNYDDYIRKDAAA